MFNSNYSWTWGDVQTVEEQSGVKHLAKTWPAHGPHVQGYQIRHVYKHTITHIHTQHRRAHMYSLTHARTHIQAGNQKTLSLWSTAARVKGELRFILKKLHWEGKRKKEKHTQNLPPCFLQPYICNVNKFAHECVKRSHVNLNFVSAFLCHFLFNTIGFFSM